MSETRVSVWTHNHDQAWLDSNSQISDMVIMDAMPYDRAVFAAQRMHMLRPDLVFELRDVHDTVVHTVGGQAKPKRRTLGQR